MAVGAAARKFLPVMALGLVPLLFHVAIVESHHRTFVFVPGFGDWLKLGLVMASALMHWAIYSGLLLTFALTLRVGHEPLISAMTRRLHGALSAEVVVYTRRVTVAWCVFFAAQLITSVTLFFFAPLVVWSFFVNILDIPLVIAMFAAEYTVRVHYLRDPPRESLSVILTMITEARKPHEQAAGSAL
jgi:uncharacterized membrane protein